MKITKKHNIKRLMNSVLNVERNSVMYAKTKNVSNKYPMMQKKHTVLIILPKEKIKEMKIGAKRRKC